MLEMKMAMTIEEAAEYTSIGRNTMRQLVEQKMLPVLRVGRKILIPTEELKGFLQLNQNVDLRKRDEIRPWRGQKSRRERSDQDGRKQIETD